MSHILRFATAITNADRLGDACQRMRKAGLQVQGPNYVKNYPRTEDDQGTIDGFSVKLPGWRKPCVFACDESGEMVADNYSPYYDYRQINPATGERIPGSGRVHPEVEAGRKRVGEDGRWGEIEYLDRLNIEYRAATVEHAAREQGATISYESLDQETGVMTMLLDLPE